MIGVYGGSFDPIHFGHINPLFELSDIFDFHKIRLIPTYNSPVNKVFYSDIEHRLNMVSIISASDTNVFVADDTEMRKGGISYTYETIQIIKKQEQNHDICLIMGLDAFLSLENWYNYTEILNDIRLIVVNRPDSNIKEIKKMNFEILDRITSNKIDFQKNEKKQIFFYETPSINISSSDIRRRINCKESLEGLIPGSILSYIERNKLYTDLT
tara:strand:+ start:194 stop:832 length:639 start_codon:yes stop_codon:yes gene_type:complete